MTLRESVYRRYANPGFKNYLERFSLEPKILIEAGAHYGEDTAEIINFTKAEFALAFEPDPIAYPHAKAMLEKYSQVKLFNVGLGKARETNWLFLNKSRPEDGISGLNFLPSDIDQWDKHEISLETLDEIWSKHPFSPGEDSERNAFLWLDVEGHEHEALQGAKKSLNRFIVAQIEINLHDFTRQANYREVFRIMRANGYVLMFAPLHPGFFGDAVFMHKSLIFKKRLRLRGVLLRALAIFLHSFLYPSLGKPTKE